VVCERSFVAMMKQDRPRGAEVTDAFAEFGWLGEFGLFYDASCVSFARSLTPREALARLGPGSMTWSR
jgi:hypothetical protein